MGSDWSWFRNRRAEPDAPAQAGQQAELGSEPPIRTKADDQLRGAAYAVRIAGVLSELSPREGRVFVIRGGWEFGKSSLKYLLIEEPSSRINGNQVHWLDFNPWQ
ncbi:P-loop NTPase fold protein [Pseudomonas alabamensis]|uniref:P-loop NTPase fold protein n=1 Tax=Pseudomonas alabamensis TaxID=3064349 RepID=UPI003F64D9D4